MSIVRTTDFAIVRGSAAGAVASGVGVASATVVRVTGAVTGVTTRFGFVEADKALAKDGVERDGTRAQSRTRALPNTTPCSCSARRDSSLAMSGSAIVAEARRVFTYADAMDIVDHCTSWPATPVITGQPS